MSEKLLRRNVCLYGWFKVFNKRVFLPTTAIYLVDVGHVSVGQIGIIGVVTALVTLLAQMPSGYLADRYTRRAVLMTGSAILAAGVAVLVVSPSFVSGLLAGALTGLGFAFLAGAGQALMYDSLEQYGKVMGRAQSKGLIGNIVLIALVPMTYTVDARLPFVLGALAFFILFAIAWAFVGPEREDRPDGDGHIKELIVAIRTFVHKRTVWLFVAIGVAFGLYSAPIDYTNLVLNDLGLAAQYLGWAFAGSSLLGAIGGYAIHHLQKLRFKTFMFMDVLICCGLFVMIGLTRNLWVAIAAFLINLSFWRLRGILYQHYLLELFSGTRHKATLVSLVGFGEQLFVVVLPLLFAFAITHWGYYTGYVSVGLFMALVLGALTAYGFAVLHRAAPKVPAPAKASGGL